MNLSGEPVGHRMDEKLLWGPGARILPQARPLSPAAETVRERSPRGEPSSSCAKAAGRSQRQGDGSSPPSLTVAEEPERAEVGLGLYAEQPDPRHLVQLGNAFI